MVVDKLTEHGVVFLTTDKQRELLDVAEAVCRQEQSNYIDALTQLFEHNSSAYSPECPVVWDGITCWPAAAPGSMSVQPCPDYVNRFIIANNATKRCEPDSTWWVNPDTNDTWTNFSSCTYAPEIDMEKLERLRILEPHLSLLGIITNVGYSISIASLIVAIIILLGFRRLHCPRNTIHINCFISFIIKAMVVIIIDNTFVEGIGLPKDVMLDDHSNYHFITHGTHWECRLIATLFEYSILTNYVWIFLEALYLHMLIFSAFSENSRVHWYILAGWIAPLFAAIPWAIVRAVLQNHMCWMTHDDLPPGNFLWIVKVPIILAIVGSFVLFLRIIRVLFTKLAASQTPERRKLRYRKMAKSTCVLVIAYGVHYVCLLAIDPMAYELNVTMEMVKLYFELPFQAFQGFFVAVIFCFLNNEVRHEVCKKWKRFRLRRESLTATKHSTLHTFTTNFCSESRPANNSSNSRPDSQSDDPLLVPRVQTPPVGKNVHHVTVAVEQVQEGAGDKQAEEQQATVPGQNGQAVYDKLDPHFRCEDFKDEYGSEHEYNETLKSISLQQCNDGKDDAEDRPTIDADV